MLELAMLTCLAVMGFYFFKSTDLPKELKERSAQFHSETATKPSVSKFPSPIIIPNQMALTELNLRKKAAELKIHNAELDQLTLTITALEQELKTNKERNLEIQTLIDQHLISLQKLHNKIQSLS